MADFAKFNKHENTTTEEVKTPRRTKGTLMDLATGVAYHIEHHGISDGKFGKYAWIHVREDKEHTYYASACITRTLAEVDEDPETKALLPDQPVRFIRRSFTRNDGEQVEYVDMEFIVDGVTE